MASQTWSLLVPVLCRITYWTDLGWSRTNIWLSPTTCTGLVIPISSSRSKFPSSMAFSSIEFPTKISISWNKWDAIWLDWEISEIFFTSLSFFISIMHHVDRNFHWIGDGTIFIYIKTVMPSFKFSKVRLLRIVLLDWGGPFQFAPMA